MTNKNRMTPTQTPYKENKTYGCGVQDVQEVKDLIQSTDGCTTCPSAEVPNLGVIFDSTISFEPHLKSITRSALFHLRNISRLWPSLPDCVSEILIHAFITSHLDYCYEILFRLTDKAQDRLQCVQNSATRVLTCTKPRQHINLVLQNIHWLPIKFHDL